MKCFVAVLALASAAVASPVADHSPYAPEPAYHPAPEPAYHPAPAPYHPAPAPYHPKPKYHEPEEAPKNYAYGYDVAEYDEYGNPNVHSKHEERDGYQVKGQYRVQLPDCRTQIVDYYVDEYKAYHADVKYEGQICEDYTTKKGYHGDSKHAPSYKHAPAPYKAPAPAPYHPEPVYKAAPAPYKPAPAPYKPAPAPYKPAPYKAPEPAYKPAPAPYKAPEPVYSPASYQPEPAYRSAPEPAYAPKPVYTPYQSYSF